MVRARPHRSATRVTPVTRRSFCDPRPAIPRRARRSRVAASQVDPRRACAVLIVRALLGRRCRRWASPPRRPRARPCLRVGWVNEPDNLNPFIGYSTSSYLDLPPQLRPADRLQGRRTSSRRPSSPRAGASRPTARCGRSSCVRASSGRTACPSPPATWPSPTTTSSTTSSRPTRATRSVSSTSRPSTTSRRASSAAAPSRTCSACGCPSCPSTSGRRSAPRRPRTPSRTSRPSSAPVPSRSSTSTSRTTSCAWWPTRTTGAARPMIDEVVFTAYRTPTRWSRTSRAGAIDACWGVPEGQFAPLSQTTGFKTIAYVVKGFDELGFNCYTGPSLGNPVLKDWRFRQALNWAIDKQQLVKIAYAGYARARRHHHRAQVLHEPRLALAAAGRPALRLRPGQGDAAAGRLPATGPWAASSSTSRASRSRCVCSPATRRRRARRSASSSPPGCRRSASR